tara:strand:+ start:546 stop:1259 length:714 start_codon:yes stop_codon:yes gene_type:complete
MKILISSCTKHDATKFKETKLYTSILKNLNDTCIISDNVMTFLSGNINAVVRLKNDKNIGIHYNKCIALGKAEGFDCVIFIHDDVSLEDGLLAEKLTEAFKRYDVVGLAGTKDVVLRKPALWHLLSKEKDRSGIVAHADGNYISSTYFGPVPQRCVLLDGLFLAVKLKDLPAEVLFDENLPAIAHHYDLDFCLTANKHKLKLTTWPIWVVHDSPGLENVESDFIESENYFLHKWLKN